MENPRRFEATLVFWLVVDQPLWKMREFVSWDDEIPNWMESHKIPWFQTTNQTSIEVSKNFSNQFSDTPVADRASQETVSLP